MLNLALISILLVMLTAPISGQEKSCQQVHTEMNKKETNWTNDCVKELNYSAKEKVEKSNCVWKCMLINLKVLSPEGNLDKVQLDRHIAANYPPNMIQRATKVFDVCLAVTVDGSMTDEKCKQYQPLVKCINQQFAHLCDDA